MNSLSKRKWRSELQGLGDRARDQGDFLAAAELYENALAISDGDLGLVMIAGHMRKEGKDFFSAEGHYRRLLEATPNDPEIHMQLGHFYKTVGRYKDAMSFYAAALEKGYPDTGRALDEIHQLNRHEGLRRELHREHAGQTGDRSGLVGSRLLPRQRDDLRRHYREAMNISRLGNRQKTRWGIGWTLRGIEAVRGHILSSLPYGSLEIFLGQRLIHSEKLSGVPLRREYGKSNLRKYVFNAWIDFSGLPLGNHDLIIKATPLQGELRHGIEWQQYGIVVAEPIPVDSDVDNPAVVPALDGGSPLSVVDQVNSLPSIVHRVAPGYTGKLDTVAVMRLDQLGDMVVTLPALRRLRELLPDARIVGLVSSSNIDLTRTLGIFDDVVAVKFPDDASQEKRVMDERAQAEFIELCRPFRFDLAIDFLYSGHAAKLLPLTGAPVTMTVARSDQGETMEVAFDSRSPSGGHSLNPMSHTARVRVISEALALWLDNEAKPLPRETSSEAQLARYGLNTSDRYVVLHTGSSFARFLRWPHYPEVTEKLLEAGYKVLYMASDDGDRARLPANAINDGRIVYLARKIPFDDLDALLSSASLMIGNDSGPKHWASLRGTRVISIHPGRDDLREWGQVFGGVVLGRRVPCAGCGIRYDDSECGQDFACIKHVRIEEVLREALTPSSW